MFLCNETVGSIIWYWPKDCDALLLGRCPRAWWKVAAAGLWPVLLSSRPWSWSRVVSRPNLPVLVLVLNCPVLVLTTGLGLGLAFKQDQDLITLINFYCVISATKLWLLYITETHCLRFRHDARILSTSCSHGTVFVYQRHLRRLKGCSATVVYLWGRIVPAARLEESVLSHLVFLKCDRHLDY